MSVEEDGRRVGVSRKRVTKATDKVLASAIMGLHCTWGWGLTHQP